MKYSFVARLTATLFVSFICAFGCKPKDTMPAPLPADQLPAVMQQAFASAPASAKALAGEVVAAVQAKDYSKALSQVQALTVVPKLKKEQISVASRALITINELLQAAQAQGDQNATQTLQNYQRLK
jgi:hypothetical protein